MIVFYLFALCPLVWAGAELLEPEPSPKFVGWMLALFYLYAALAWYFTL